MRKLGVAVCESLGIGVDVGPDAHIMDVVSVPSADWKFADRWMNVDRLYWSIGTRASELVRDPAEATKALGSGLITHRGLAALPALVAQHLAPKQLAGQAQRPAETGHVMPGQAFGISDKDVANVLASNPLGPALEVKPAAGDLTFLVLANQLMPLLDMQAIEDAALQGDDLDQQTDYAHDEIARQLRAKGVLEPLSDGAESPEVPRERSRA